MKLLLQSHDRFDEFAEFDLDIRSLTMHSKQREPEKWGEPAAGWYSVVDGVLVVLFRLDHELFLSVGEKSYAIDTAVHARVEGGETLRRFILVRGEEELVNVTYRAPRSTVPPELDFTQTEPEHFDFFLFVRNILEDPGRRRFAMGFPRD